MLGKLFSLGTGAPSSSSSTLVGAAHDAYSVQPSTSLESVQEDMHTRNLLYPDADALFQNRNGQVFPLSSGLDLPPSLAHNNAFDDRGELELDFRDVRILIMQDALGSASSAALLHDSHAPSPAQENQAASNSSPASSSGASDTRSKTAAMPPPKASIGSARTQQESPQPRQGAFDRRASLQGGRVSHTPETEPQKLLREYREELATFSGCVFGNSELMAYKGTSTKVHVMPCNSADPHPDGWNAAGFGDGRGSIGRSKGSRVSQSQSQSQSCASDFASPTQVPPPTTLLNPIPTPRQSDRQRVLITRLFPVALSTDDGEPPPTFSPQGRHSEDGSGFPFPQTDDAPSKKKLFPPRPKRTPMYAVVLVVNLPQTSSHLVPPKSSFRAPGSYTDQDSFPSSYGSTKRSGWSSSNYNDLGESAFVVDVEDRIDALTQHWDIIMRTLTHLQSTVAMALLSMLKCASIASPDPYSPVAPYAVPRNSSALNKRVDDLAQMKHSKSSPRLVFLQPNCLAQDRHIAQLIDGARGRIVMGLGTARVVTGQGRWGIWRDEVRSMSKLTGRKEHDSFFINLLTGFLATHTDWLQALSPASYRKRHIMQQRPKTEEDLSLSARTIIVSNDKMMARRLVFLLSAFLPTNQQIPLPRAHRPSTAASGPTSNSPPSFIVPLFREESLRKKINRRGGPRHGSHSRTVSHSGRVSGVPAQLAHLSMEESASRRDSDNFPLRPPTVIPGLTSDAGGNRKSMAIATEIAPENTVPHFASVLRPDESQSGGSRRPCSTGSTIADDLKRSLKRGESTGNISQASSDSKGQSYKWGSVISGLWTGKKTGSAGSTTIPTQDTSQEYTPPPSRSEHLAKPTKLEQMVREAAMSDTHTKPPPPPPPPPPSAGTKAVDVYDAVTPRGPPTHAEPDARPDSEHGLLFTPASRMPDPTGAFVSPIKTSINAEDGVIDVDVPFPDFLTSFETAVSSPSSSGYLSTPGFGGLESFEHSSRMTMEGDLPLNVAGWLPLYHPDFALQAIPHQEGVMETIKASLRAEPSPPTMQTNSNEPDRWLDVSSAIIADVTTNSVTRIRYRRLVRPRTAAERPPAHPAVPNLYGGALPTPSIQPYEVQLEEEFIIDPVITLDDILTEAVDKVIGLNTDTPAATMPATSSSGVNVASHMADASHDGSARSLDVPREQCKTVVLSALEAVIRTTIEATERETQSRLCGTRNNIIRGDKESLLREAVRVWLQGIDMGD